MRKNKQRSFNRTVIPRRKIKKFIFPKTPSIKVMGENIPLLFSCAVNSPRVKKPHSI